MKRLIFFVTGTDTGVGKTVLTSLLARHFKNAGLPVAALKPLCSGDRDDAVALHSALDGALTLDEINPWHFSKPVAPLVAARKAKRKVTLAQVTAQVRSIQKRFPLVIVEGAGGLLSPLGEGFDSRDLIERLRAVPLVVCPNRLGAINQTRLVLAALPPRASGKTQVILTSPAEPDGSTPTNAAMLSEFFAPERIHVLPRTDWRNGSPSRSVQKKLESLTEKLLGEVQKPGQEFLSR